jgi:hypothetical protein
MWHGMGNGMRRCASALDAPMLAALLRREANAVARSRPGDGPADATSYPTSSAPSPAWPPIEQPHGDLLINTRSY